MTCVPATQNFPSLKDFQRCENSSSIPGEIRILLSEIIRKLMTGCERTCISTLYSPVVNTFNRGLSGTKDLFALHAYYVTTSVVISREFYIYDSITLVTSLGGTLGLLLGYSALSMILFC